MTRNGADVVIVGGGIVGVATAYFLGEAGVPSVVIERDSVGSHASGFAYGGLNPLAGEGIPGPLFPVAKEGMRLHRELARSLPEETGVTTEFRPKPSLALAFTEPEVDGARSRIRWQQEQEGYTVSWCDAAEARAIEPRISPEALGAVYLEGAAEVEPYRFMLALSQAAEARGATIRHGRVTGLARRNGRVTAVVLDGEEVPCDRLVLAMAPGAVKRPPGWTSRWT